MPNFILYKNLAVEDFLAAWKAHREKGAAAFMPSDAQLRDFKFEGKCAPKADDPNLVPLSVFFFNQYDMVQDETTAFTVLHSDRTSHKFLENTARRLRIDMRGQGLDTLFRVDPRYGLVVGTAQDSVDPTVRADRNHCYVTLVITKDASHPEVSLLDYADRDHQARYKEMFQQINQTPPKKRGMMGFDLSKLRSGGLKGEGESPFRHEHVRYFAGAFRERYGMRDMTVSLIYKNVTEDDLRRCILDPGKGLFVPTGECRFFASTEELLA